MINIYKYEGKTEDECRIKCLEELDVYNNEIIIKQIDNNENVNIDVVKKEDIINYIDKYLNEVISKMGIDVRLKITEEDEIFNVKMISKSNPILIGKDGKTLSSLQSLLRQTLSNQTGFNIKVNLDASNYKAKKEKYFESDIKKIINDVMKSKDEVKLDPMNSYNRRKVHSVASEYYNIETESFGEEPNRYVVIRYVEK